MKKFQQSLASALLGLALLDGGCGHDNPGPGTDPNNPPPNQCGSCAAYELCDTATKTCSVNPSSTWFLSVDSARIATTTSSGDAWDVFGGAPDPFVLLDSRQTTTKQDTFTPTWQEGATYTAATLTGPGVSVTVYDEDPASNDLIGGPSIVRFTNADLRRGSLTLMNLGQVLSLSMSLTPR